MSLNRRYPELPANFSPQDLTSAWGQLLRMLESRDQMPLTPTRVDGEVKHVTEDTNMDLKYSGVSVDATSGDVTVSLPNAALIPYKSFFIKKVDSSANTVTVDAADSETIDGTGTFVISTENKSIIIKSDGVNWIIIGEYL